MDRPASIVRFEQFYLGHIVVGLVGSVVALFGGNNPALAQTNETIGPWFVPAILGLGLLTQIAFFYFIGRKGSAVAKWLLVALTAINLMGAAFLVFGLVTGFGADARSTTGSAFSLGASVLLIAAVGMLFRPDTSAWFDETGPAA